MNWLSRHRRKLHRDQSGAALIEMSVVFPVLFAIGLGVIEFGNLFYGYHLIANGVRDGARYASGLPLNSANNNVKCIAMTGGTTGADCNAGGSPSCTTKCRVSWWNNGATIAISTTQTANDNGAGGTLYRGGDFIYTVTVTATVPYQSLGFLGYFNLLPPTLRVAHQERLIGVR